MSDVKHGALTKRRPTRKAARASGLSSAARVPLQIPRLPSEVLENIISHVDTKAALNLSLSSSLFHSLAEPVLCRDVDLARDKAYTPETFKRVDDGTGALTKLRRPADVHRMAVQKRITALLLAGTRRRWSWVRSLKLFHRPGLGPSIGAVLELASPNLVSLRADKILGTSIDRDPADQAPLDICLLDSAFVFAALARIQFGSGTLVHSACITLLCDASPNLTHLDVEIDVPDQPHWFPTRTPKLGLQRPTRLQDLRLSWTGTVPPSQLRDTATMLRSLLRASPDVRNLSLHVPGNENTLEQDNEKLFEIIARYRRLQCLYWFFTTDAVYHGMRHAEEEKEDPFPALRVLVASCFGECFEIFSLPPWIPSLEIFHIDYFEFNRELPANYDRIPSSQVAILPCAQPMINNFASSILDAPNLRVFAVRTDGAKLTGRFDDFDRLRSEADSGAAKGYVSSFHRGEEVLLHVRISLDFVETYDVPWGEKPACESNTAMEYADEAVDEDREKYFDLLPEPVDQTFTDYAGRVVPLEIIEAMRKEQGMSRERWYQRGVQVGEQAWAVLTSWAGQQVKVAESERV